MELYIVRHSQSKTNIGIDGEDPGLTEVGKIQAKRLDKPLSKLNLSKVYCSPAKRTRETLEQIPSLKNTPTIYAPQILERSLGVYTENGINNWTAFFKDAKDSGVDLRYFRPKSGESLQDVYERAGNFYQEVLKKNSDNRVLLLSHELFSLCTILYALGLDINEDNFYPINNASISTLSISNNQVTRYNINDCNHLLAGALEERVP